jgi:exosortase/archaeosortase family protein
VASTAVLPAPAGTRPDRRAGFSAPFGRLALLRAVYLLGIVNTGYLFAADSAIRSGFWPALLALFDISAFTWAALAAVWMLLGEASDQPASRADLTRAAAVAATCLIPIPYCAAVATSALALWAILASRPGSLPFRASLVALSALAALFWGKLLLAAMGPKLLALDVALVRLTTGLAGHDNIIEFAGQDPAFVGKSLMVATPCSSLHWVSIALLAWVLVTQVFDLPAGRRTIFFGLLGVAGSIAVNVARLGAMGYYPAWFDWLHLGPGAVIAGWLCTMLVMAANLGGNWRAITRSG